jgi:uncharacterized membrane protein YfcA
VADVNRGRSRSAQESGSTYSGPPVVHSITSAAQAHSDDLDTRIKRYLISMAIRTVCFILVLVIHSPARWVFAVLAIVLPYIAVVMANAANNRRRRPAARPVPVARVPLVGSVPAADFPSESDVRSDPSPERMN